MCKDCGCKEAGKPIQYQCDCGEGECSCSSIIEFDEEPTSLPYCCGVPMKRIL
jgi:hypothetical protein